MYEVEEVVVVVVVAVVFWPHPQYVKIPGPGVKPELQLQLWQNRIFNSMDHRETPGLF